MNLTGYKIFNMSGIKDVALTGDFDAKSLGQKFVQEWVPYIDCDRKCPRSDYCKYTEPSPYHGDRLRDVKCGVVADTLLNFTNCTFHILQSLSSENVSNYLDGAFYLSQFVLDAEHMVGTCMSNEVIEWYGEYAPGVFGNLTRLRDELNKIAYYFSGIPEFRSVKGVIFVEGWTEKVFLEKLRESRSSWFLNLNIEVYHGKGNRKSKRIQMLLDHYNKQGYKVYIQGDADGQHSGVFEDLVQKGSVTQGCTFVFKHDFESSIPPTLLLTALHDLGEMNGIEANEFINKIYPLNQSVVHKIKDIFGLDLDPIKLDIAPIIAEQLNDHRWAWWQDEKFMETELGQFLRFIQEMI